MKFRIISFASQAIAAALSVLWLASIGSFNPSPSTTANLSLLQQNSRIYYCDETNYEYPTLVFRSDLGNAPLVEFSYAGFEDYPPLKRCREIAGRAEAFHELGTIGYLTAERTPEGHMAICVAKSEIDHETAEEMKARSLVRLLITLKPEDDPQEILAALKGTYSPKRGLPIVH